MLVRLQAEEDMRAMAVVAAGTGSMKKSDHRRYIGELSKAIGSGRKQVKTVQDWEAMGVTVVREPAKEG